MRTAPVFGDLLTGLDFLRRDVVSERLPVIDCLDLARGFDTQFVEVVAILCLGDLVTRILGIFGEIWPC